MPVESAQCVVTFLLKILFSMHMELKSSKDIVISVSKGEDYKMAVGIAKKDSAGLIGDDRYEREKEPISYCSIA
jgi:hypothetical protein